MIFSAASSSRTLDECAFCVTMQAVRDASLDMRNRHGDLANVPSYVRPRSSRRHRLVETMGQLKTIDISCA